MCVLKIRTFALVQAVLLLILCSWTVPSHAWQLHDHELITRRALQLYERCQAISFTHTEAKTLIAGNLSEDFNLAVKWLKNSHYYNPDKWVRTLYRDDAGYRVQYLTEKLLAKRHPQLRLLGKIIHFVQDMASPTHVVPIVHNLKDGFEKFKLPASASALLNLCFAAKCGKDLPTAAISLPCPSKAAASPTVVLKREARRTLASLRDIAEATRDGQPYEFTWTLFWVEGLGSKFGHYGFFGNNFGTTQPLEVLGHVYSFPHSVFHNYKLQRTKQAITATAETLHWYRSQAAP